MIKPTCPECGAHKLTQFCHVYSDAEILGASPLPTHSEGKLQMHYGEVHHEDVVAGSDAYECFVCGHVEHDSRVFFPELHPSTTLRTGHTVVPGTPNDDPGVGA